MTAVFRPRSPYFVTALYAGGCALLAVGRPLHDAAAHLYFAIALGGGLVAGARLVGGRIQTLIAVGALLLMACQRLSGSAIPAPPSSQWVTPLRGPMQLIRHAIALPRRDGEWDSLAARTREVAAYVCARGPLAYADGLELWVNDRVIERITETVAIGPRPQSTSVGFYRVPLPYAVLDGDVVLTLRRSTEANDRPIDVCGTFSYRPLSGADASAHFDGAEWTYPGRTQRGRYVIELRLHDAAGRTIAALY